MPEQITEIKYDNLHLDIDNPRLPNSVSRDHKSILTWIAKSTSIEDLMNAIATNGFFPGEPIVAYPKPNSPGHFIVVEGNRRLTAVRLIHNPDECDKPSILMRQIHEAAAHRPEYIPVVIQQSRDEVLPYLGFRHITGIKEWDPLAKARYILQLFNYTDSTLTPLERYKIVANEIGSRRDRIKRDLTALAVYNVIADNNFFDIYGLSEVTLKYSILSTALADEKIAAFAGVVIKNISSSNDEIADYEHTDPIVNPSYLKISEIKELTEWLYKKDGGKTILGESRNLRKLSEVVDSQHALAALRSGSTLDQAYQLTSAVKKDFISILYNAQALLAEASSIVADVEYDSLALDVARSIRNQIKLLAESILSKRVGDDDEF